MGSDPPAEADADAVIAATACAGGGALSRVDVTDAGSASIAWRKPRSMKSRWLCIAFRLVKISECSSECFDPSTNNQ